MITRETILALIDERIADTSCFLVSLEISSGNAIKVLIDDDEGASVKRCIEVSRAIEHNLDREIEDFSLQVSSPGLDKPLLVHRQYLKNLGRGVLVKLNPDEAGKKEKIEGELIKVEDDKIVVKTRTKERLEAKKSKQWVEREHVLPFAEIEETKIVISFK